MAWGSWSYPQTPQPQPDQEAAVPPAMMGALRRWIGLGDEANSDQTQAAAEGAAARVRAPYAKANERVSGLPDVGTVLGNKLVNTFMAGPNLMGQVAEGSVDPNSPEAIRRSADVAASTLGYGMMGARPGGAGMAGGKLTQPAAVAEGATKTGGLGDFIQAYHGSPHDFDRFDLSKIGTGEGAQAYGHGLYFAENEGVAKQYRSTLSKGAVDWDDPHAVAAHFMDAANGDRGDALFQAKTHVGIKNFDALTKAQDLIESGAPVGASKAGKMYQVAIKAPPEHFLDWDKPLSEQSPKVQEALLNARYGGDKVAVATAIKSPDYMGRSMQAFMSDLAHPKVLGSHDQASAALREAGIPGIKYLDNGSRIATNPALQDAIDHVNGLKEDLAKETSKVNRVDLQEKIRLSQQDVDHLKMRQANQTRNYVVFDHDLIDILKKYGIAGVGALPAMNAYHFQKSDTGS